MTSAGAFETQNLLQRWLPPSRASPLPPRDILSSTVSFLQQGDLRVVALFRRWLASKKQEVEGARPALGAALASLPLCSVGQSSPRPARGQRGGETDCPSQWGGGKATLQGTRERGRSSALCCPWSSPCQPLQASRNSPEPPASCRCSALGSEPGELYLCCRSQLNQDFQTLHGL